MTPPHREGAAIERRLSAAGACRKIGRDRVEDRRLEAEIESPNFEVRVPILERKSQGQFAQRERERESADAPAIDNAGRRRIEDKQRRLKSQKLAGKS